MADGHEPTERPITPLPAPADAERVVLFGGSFDPPTRAHAHVADLARRHAAGPEAWLVFVPAARSPFKPDAPTADRHRAAMLRLVTRGLDRAAVWTDEIDRAGEGEQSFWVDTLRRAREARPGVRLWFILGADQAAAFERWREPREILKLAQPAVVLRDPIATVEDLQRALEAGGFWTDVELAEWCGSVVDAPPVEGSATEARAALAASGSSPISEELVCPDVLAYIRAHHLYCSTGS